MTDTETTVLYDIPDKIIEEHAEISENTNLQSDSHLHTDKGNTDENNTQIDSEEIKNHDNNENVISNEQKIQKKRVNLIDSDSEDEINSEKPAQIISEQDLNSDNESLTQLNSKTHKKRLTLIDSDSEDEKNIEFNSQNIDENNKENTAGPVNKSNKNRLTILDSDSEDETNDDTVKTNEPGTKEDEDILPKEDQKQKKKSRLLQVCDSDSEEEKNTDDLSPNKENTAEPVNKTNKKRFTQLESNSEDETNDNRVKTNENDTKENEDIFPKEDQAQKKKSRLLQLCDSDSEEEKKTDLSSKISETEDEIQHQTLQRLKTLCDSESSAEETEDNNEDISKKNIIKQKRQRKKAEPKEKKMTGKEAQEQRREIMSESQKMVRESRVHLPYHVPKQRTLQEFLQRRCLVKGSTKAPPNTPTGLSIKMCSKNIKTIQMKLKQKEKEIEEFYKSESEAEEEQELEPSKEEVVQESTQKDGQNVENQMQENSESKPEEITENAEKMDVDTNETQETTSENINKEKINEERTQKINSEGPQIEENNQESSVKKSSEDSQQNMIEEQEAGAENTQFEKISEEFNEEMEVDEQSSNNKIGEETNDTQITSDEHSSNNKTGEETNDTQRTSEMIEKVDEQSSNNKNEEDTNQLQNTTGNTEDISEIRETEQDTLDSEQNTEAVEENRVEKLKELRDILEKSLTHSEPDFDDDKNVNEMETEETELENIISPLEQSQNSAQEAIRMMAEKEEKKKKLAEIEEKLNKLNPLVALKGNFHPKLSGGPNEVIILDENIEQTKRVTNFMQRFLSHAVKKSDKKQYSILNTTKVPIEDLCEEPDKKIQIPGIRMKKLRLELTSQISKQRLEELKKKQEEKKLDNEDETFVGEKEICELSNKVLDNEEEDELTDPSSSSEEEEEEDDIEIKENPRTKSAFMDDEAEESDDVENEDEEMDNNEEDEDESEIEDQDEETNLEPPSKKPLSRIIKPADDSDEDTSSRPASSLNEEKRPSIGVTADITASQSSTNDNWKYNDDDIPAYQQPSDGLEKTPCKSATQKKDVTHFLTPTLHLTALQGMSSATKSLQGSPNVSSFLPPEPSPLKLNHLVKTKLFSDQEEINLDELENLCSGKFTTQIENPENRNNEFSTQENELLGICSGRFTGFTQSESSTSLDSSIPVPKPTQSLDLLMNEDSQNFKLTIENDTTDYIENTNTEEQKRSIEESNQQNLKPQNNVSTSKYLKMKICSSSEDEDKEDAAPKTKKLQKKKRKYIIDDISITDEDEFEDNLEDELDEDIEESRNVDYDSEENEIEIDEEQDLEEAEKPVKKASDFFEAEAELSESDWGSEDEDEKNLDDYEIEEGDEEKINEKKVQRELERMHMRNILDDDQREVKLLQELLLEDGELHGTGRERKFRWKNADLLWNNDSEKPKEEEEEQEEIECEMQWRKMRHEREMFLQEHQSKRPPGEDEILNDSQLMKLGQKALKKSLFGSQSQNSSQKKTPIAESVATTEDIKLPFALAIKRGSFLQRSETTLQRLAEITKISGNIGGPKNSKNFVFTAVDKTEMEEEEVNVKKRKAEEGTPKILKKLRIADMSPNVQKRKKKLPI